uniref:Uncharacterized protein n=1 Tax=Arundo donax TaxID=35708 RepID=A0A0A9HYE1_ARUDO
MMMQLRTFSMTTVSKVMLETAPIPPCHVLIRTPASCARPGCRCLCHVQGRK